MVTFEALTVSAIGIPLGIVVGIGGIGMTELVAEPNILPIVVPANALPILVFARLDTTDFPLPTNRLPTISATAGVTMISFMSKSPVSVSKSLLTDASPVKLLFNCSKFAKIFFT